MIADRIEIMNHGGLYGRANESNFPNVNDYRNIVVAEAMKVLGFVNRHSRGVLRVQKELKANENGEAVYDFGYQTAILVRENKSPLGERMMAEAIVNGYLTENNENSAKTAISNKKPSKKQTGKQPKKQPIDTAGTLGRTGHLRLISLFFNEKTFIFNEFLKKIHQF